MALVITNPNIVPPGHFRYKDAKTGVELKFHTVQGLMKKVIAHKNANNIGFDQNEFLKNVCTNTRGDICQNSEEPKVAGMVRRFASEMAHWASSGFKTADPQTLQSRLEQCQRCEHWKGILGGSIMQGGCKLCGCNGVKLALATSHCPNGLWQLLMVFFIWM